MADYAVPDRLGEVEGWRAWRLVGGKRFPLLASVTHSGTIWHPDRWTFATCNGDLKCQGGRGNKSKGETVPGTACSCGLYAAATRRQLVGMRYPHYADHYPVFIGRVAFAGKVIAGTHGWRAEKGRIAELYVPHVFWRYVDQLEAVYEVPVHLENTLRASEGR